MTTIGKPRASFSVDVEQDCPPYLSTVRGMEQGMPRLLDLLARTEVKATFFTTGQMARGFPAVIERLVAEGHELGSHSDTHPDFAKLSMDQAEREIARSAETLRRFGTVSSFRAPYLRFPTTFLPILARHGYTLDSSAARYKAGGNHRDLGNSPSGLVRVPVSVTSSVLRLPSWIRDPWLRSLASPVVLFVHPWEFVDLRAERLRWDCRFHTGPIALNYVDSALALVRSTGKEFVTMQRLCE